MSSSAPSRPRNDAPSSERSISSVPPAMPGEAAQSLEEWVSSHCLKTACTIPRELTPTKSHELKTRTSADDLAIEGKLRPLAQAVRVRSGVQRVRVSTDAQREALALLRAVPEPLTPMTVSLALGWTPQRARRWLERFAARGLLETHRTGRRWRVA